MKTKIFSTLIAIAIIVSLTGCVNINYGGGGGGISGKGEIVTKTYALDTAGDYTGLTIKIAAELHLTDDDSDTMTIKLYENWADLLNVDITGNGVMIDSDKNFRINVNNSKKNLPQIFIPASKLESLNVLGIVTIADTNTVIAGESFAITMSGVASGKINLDVQELDVFITGVGDLALSGTAESATIYSSGVGSLKAFGLITQSADITISGVGSVELHCVEKLNARLTGVGSISYKGNPSVTQKRTGVGSIRNVE